MLEAKKKLYRVMPNKHVTTDAVCASIAYAYLQRHVYQNNSQVVLPAKLNGVTQFILQKFNISEPETVMDIYPRPKDIAREQLIFINQNDSLSRALEIYSLYKIRLMPIVDDEMHVVGVITFYDLVKAFVSPLDSNELNTVFTNTQQVQKTLNGSIFTTQQQLQTYKVYNVSLSADQFAKTFSTYSDEQFAQTIFVTTQNTALNQMIADRGAGMIVVCSDEPNFQEKEQNDSDDLYVAKKHTFTQNINTNVPVIYTTKRMTEATILIKQSTPVSSYMSPDQLSIVDEKTQLEEIARKLNKNKDLSGVVVVNQENKLVNVVTRHDVNLQKLINVTLVGTMDIQSIPGLQAQGVHVEAIIDHHPPKISSTDPMLYQTRGTACTSSIVAMIYEEHDIVPPVAIAGVLLSGILGTTQLLQSPRTTSEDARLARYLGVVCGIDFLEYGRLLVQQITLNWNFQSVISYDLRILDLPIGQIRYFGFETGDFGSVTGSYVAGLLDVMNQQREKGVLCTFCLVANILDKRGLILVEADNVIIKQFGQLSGLSTWKDYQNIFEAENMISKRAKFLPLLQDVMTKMVIDQ